MKINHIAISVKDLEKSVKFYTKSFGFKEIKRFTKEDWNGEAVILELNGFKLELFGFNDYKESKDDSSDLRTIGLKHFAIQVEDLNKKYEELKEKGIDIDTPKKGTTCKAFCFLRDFDKITIELFESK